MILTSSYTRVQAVSSEGFFLGWKHFVHELNTFLNKNVTKDTQGLEYVTLDVGDYGAPKDEATIKVFTGEKPPLDYDPVKLISGTKYFLGSHGLKITGVQQDADSWDAIITGLPRFGTHRHYQGMKNTWMKNALLRGMVIDVRETGVEVEPGVFKLSHYIPDTQYVDSEEEQFIFSIGKDKSTGEIFAAYDTRFYGDDDYETLYLH